MNINYKGKEITLKCGLKAMLMYENVTGGSSTPSNLTDVITFFYCIVVASSKDYSIQFEDFVDWVDENPDTMEEFSKWMNDIVTTNNRLKKN